MNKCPRCGGKSKDHPQYGPQWCKQCKEEFKSKPKNRLDKNQYEWAPDRIKEARKKYAKDLVQPYREGVASQEFIDTYPEQSKKLIPKEDRKKAKKVWHDIKGL